MKRMLAICLILVSCTKIGANMNPFPDPTPSPGKGKVERTFTISGLPQRNVNALCTNGDFLYAGINDEIYCIDISTPTSPVVKSHTRLYGLVRQITVQDGTLFAACRESGVWFVDINNPDNIKVLLRYDPIELSTGIEVAGNVLFLGTRQNGVECVDISDIMNPRHIRVEKTSESQSVTYRDGYLYSGEWGGHCITVIDAHDMSSLRTIRTVNLHGYGDGLWTYGNYLYASTGHHLTDSCLSSEEKWGNGHGLEIFDISNPEFPVFVSRVSFDNAYSTNNDYWTPRPCSNGKYVICADSVNGMYIVDASKPKMPKVVDHVSYKSSAGKAIAVTSIAIAKGVIFASVYTENGIVGFVHNGIFPNTKDKGAAPSNSSYRDTYTTASDSRFAAWKPASGAPVRGVAAGGDILYAACSFGGLAIFKHSDSGWSYAGNAGIAYASDVKVRAGRVYVAEGNKGLGVYDADSNGKLTEISRYTDFMKDGPNAYCLWVYTPDDTHIVASTRVGGNYYLDATDIHNIKFLSKIGSSPGWDKYSADKVDAKGWYPSVRHKAGIFWVNLNATTLSEEKDASILPTLADGVCSYKDNQFLTCTGGAMYFYSHDQEGMAKTPVASNSAFKGSPVWNGSNKLSLTYRLGRKIRMVDISNESAPQIVWEEDAKGYPELPIFWAGKLAVPCGYQGLLIEK